MEAAFGESPGHWPQITLRFRLLEEWDGEDWGAVGDDWQIRAYQILKTSAGLMEKRIQNLKDAFGWPGDDPFWFEDALAAGKELSQVQVVIGPKRDKPNQLEVQWINEYDRDPNARGGGLEHVADTDRQARAAQIISELRALSGAPVATPSRRTTSGPPPASSEPATELDTGIDPATSTWSIFEGRCAVAGISSSRCATIWQETLMEVCGHDDPERVGAEEWPKVATLLRQAVDSFVPEKAGDPA
jgi:hypothetical protein